MRAEYDPTFTAIPDQDRDSVAYQKAVNSVKSEQQEHIKNALCSETQTEIASTNGSIVEAINNIQLIDSSYNISGNYTSYVTAALSSIVSIHNSQISTSNTLTSPLPRLPTDKKLLLLDLDETLIHADFDHYFPPTEYDSEVSFSVNDINYRVGIFIRPGLIDFLSTWCVKFNIILFTASSPAYANAVLNLIDPENHFFKHALFRTDCVKVTQTLYVKDWDLFKQLTPWSNVIIWDNSWYSFMNQISNGIWINSFYNNKSDLELYSVMNYWIGYIENCEDVREVNEQFFNFRGIINEIQNCNGNQGTNSTN